MTLEQIITLCSTLAALIMGVYNFRLQNRKVDSDVWEKAMTANDKTMSTIQLDNDRLRGQVKESGDVIIELRADYSILHQTLDTALDRIKVLERENASLRTTNEELTRQLSSKIDTLLGRKVSRRSGLV